MNNKLAKSDTRQPIWTLNTRLSEPDNPIYSHTFPILRHCKTVLLLGEFLLESKTNKYIINVYDMCNQKQYTPYYNHDYGNFNPILDRCQKAITAELKRVRWGDVG